MAKQEETKKLERRMRMLLMEKEVPQSKMDLVKTLMNNRSIKAEERYRTIIELIQTCPDKKTRPVAEIETPHDEKRRKQVRGSKESTDKKTAPVSVPTEKSYYISDLNRKYRLLKLFRKRYLVHRSNRFGIGFRKRLIPTKKLFEIIGFISTIQERVNERLPAILTAILDDPDIEDPTLFNYIREFRRWVTVFPLNRAGYDEVKWMDREVFEREFKSFVKNYFSFMEMEIEEREQIVQLIESKLRGFDELKKFDIKETDNGEARKNKEKSNLAREREIYEYITALRFFLPAGSAYESSLTRELYEKYSVDSLEGLIEMICEALIFQKPVQKRDIISYYSIRPPAVSSETWDYSSDYLKKVGKDPESRKRRTAEKLKMELAPLDMVHNLLASEKEERSFLLYGAGQQMKYVDNRPLTPEEYREKNFLLFFDTVLNFFNNAYVPLLDGSEITFRDPGRREIKSSLFSFSILEGFSYSYTRIRDELHEIRTNNPTLTVTRDEIKRIAGGGIRTMPEVNDLVLHGGNFFYLLASEMKNHYNLHRLWVYNGRNLTMEESIRRPLDDFEIDPGNYKDGKPFPFYDCTVVDFDVRPRLAREALNFRIIDDSLKGGLLVRITAFCYQMAYECYNTDLGRELARRKELKRKIEKLTR